MNRYLPENICDGSPNVGSEVFMKGTCQHTFLGSGFKGFRDILFATTGFNYSMGDSQLKNCWFLTEDKYPDPGACWQPNISLTKSMM